MRAFPDPAFTHVVSPNVDTLYSMAAVMYFLVREPEHTAAGGSTVARPGIADLFSHRNVPLAMLTLMCAMGGVFVLAAMGPNYLTDYLKLSPQQMGFVFSAVGFGGALGQFAMSFLPTKAETSESARKARTWTCQLQIAASQISSDTAPMMSAAMPIHSM